MPAGRKKKPLQLHILNETDRPCRRNDKEPIPDIPETIPVPPDNISESAKKVWRDNVEAFYNAGVLTSLDINAFTFLAQITGMWFDAVDEFKKDPSFTRFTANGNEMQNPLVGTINTLSNLSAKYFSEFGMTPSSRTKIKVENQQKKQNKFTINAQQGNS